MTANESMDTTSGTSLQQQHDAAIQAACQQLDASSVPSTPVALKRHAQEFVPPVPGSLNGMGHPLVNDRVLLPPQAVEPMFVFKHSSKDLAGAGLAGSWPGFATEVESRTPIVAGLLAVDAYHHCNAPRRG
jgi:hypothetical protein